MLEFADRHAPVRDWEIPYFRKMFFDQMFGVSDSAYDAFYKPRKFVPETDPLRMVSMNAKEGLFELNGFRKRFLDFRSYEVNKYTGMSFTEFLELPTPYVDMILNDLRNDVMVREKRRQQQEREQQQAINHLKGPVDRHKAMEDALLKSSKA